MKKLLWLFPGLMALVLGGYFGAQNNQQDNYAGNEQVVTVVQPASSSAVLGDIVLLDTLEMEQSGEQWLGKVVLVNHWASWCAPCIEEIPLFITADETYRAQGLQVVGIAHDTLEATRIFGDQMGIDYPSLVVDSNGSELMRSQGNGLGALPFTAIFGRDGKLLQTKLGVFTGQELDDLIRQLL